jgi:hypothetical protein
MKKKTDQQGKKKKEKTCKEVELPEQTQQRIKLKQLKVIVYDDALHYTNK